MTTKPFEQDAADALAVLEEARALNKIVHINSPEPLPDAETAQILNWQEAFQLGPAGFGSLGKPIPATMSRRMVVGMMIRRSVRLLRCSGWGSMASTQLLRLCGKVDAVNVAHSRLFTRSARLRIMGSCHCSLKTVHWAACLPRFVLMTVNAMPITCAFILQRGTVRSEVTQTFDNHDMRAKKLSLQALDSEGRVVTRSVNLESEQLNGKYQWENFRDAVRSGQPLAGEIDPELIAPRAYR